MEMLEEMLSEQELCRLRIRGRGSPRLVLLQLQKQPPLLSLSSARVKERRKLRFDFSHHNCALRKWTFPGQLLCLLIRLRDFRNRSQLSF